MCGLTISGVIVAMSFSTHRLQKEFDELREKESLLREQKIAVETEIAMIEAQKDEFIQRVIDRHSSGSTPILIQNRPADYSPDGRIPSITEIHELRLALTTANSIIALDDFVISVLPTLNSADASRRALGEALLLIHSQVSELFGLFHVRLAVLADDKKGYLESICHVGWTYAETRDENEGTVFTIPVRRNLAGRALLERAISIVNLNINTPEWQRSGIPERQRIGSSAAIPMTMSGTEPEPQVAGIFIADTSVAGAFDEPELRAYLQTGATRLCYLLLLSTRMHTLDKGGNPEGESK